MNLAVGFFDGVHRGHRRILARADAAFTFLNHPAAVLAPDRAPPLLMTAESRVAALAALGVRPVAVPFTPALAAVTAEAFAARLRADFPGLDTVLCGPNWTFGAGGEGNAAFLRARGFRVETVPFAVCGGAPVSSTRIRAALAGGDMAAAAAMLGRPYAVEGRVARGKGVGRRIGYPTVNLRLPDSLVRLPFGVYDVETPDGRGLANWGFAPTMGAAAWRTPVLEVHLVDAPPDYAPRAETLRVAFRRFLRPERAFATPAALAAQIARDRAALCYTSPVPRKEQKMNVKTNARYAVACLSSMGLRITPENRMAVHNSNRFLLQATSAETNVLNVTSSLGRECLVLTRFVAGSPMAAFIKAQLRARNIAYAGPDVPQGGPWGYRHQFNIADSGFGLRAPRVWNDRAGEVGRTLNAKDYDTEAIFGRDGAGILHLSGLIAAMSPETTKACLALAKAAKKHGTLVSFDLNYRATFWKGREAELAKAFHQIASAADILVGNEEDFQLCLGMKGPEAGGKDLAAKIESFKGMIEAVAKKYKNARMFATTLRQVVSAGRHLWGAILRADGRWFVEKPRDIDVLDRIGGGDGFTGGLLYGVLNGWNGEKCLQFGWASGVMAASSLNDYAEPADEKQVWDVYAGNARVQR